MDLIENLKHVESERLIQLIELSTIINSTLKLEDVLGQVMEIANQLVHSDASSLLLLDSNTNRLNFTTTTGQKGKEIKKFSLKMGQGIAGWVAERARPLLIPDVSNDPRHYSEIDDKTGYDTHSMICVPMKWKEQLIGVLQALHQEKNKFTNEDLSILIVLGNLAALAIKNAQEHTNLYQENIHLKEVLKQKSSSVYKSPIMKNIYEMAKKVAQGSSTVLIRGKSGVGKEMLARYIHEQSSRKNKPFVCVTCSILSETLLESELFGHEKGAFTGANTQRIGKFEKANGGTLFLDEIGTLALETQLRLLRVIQEREIERVGGNEIIPIDVRIIVATNENLEQAIAEEKFREDLYYRLKVIELNIPDLKNRPEDIEELTSYFVKAMSQEIGRPVKGVSDDTMKCIKKYEWPGNVRELKNAIERAIVLGSQEWLMPEDLPYEVVNPASSTTNSNNKIKSNDDSLSAIEKIHIEEVLRKTNGNKSKAAKLLGISRNRLDRKIEGTNSP